MTEYRQRLIVWCVVMCAITATAVWLVAGPPDGQAVALSRPVLGAGQLP